VRSGPLVGHPAVIAMLAKKIVFLEMLWCKIQNPLLGSCFHTGNEQREALQMIWGILLSLFLSPSPSFPLSASLSPSLSPYFILSLLPFKRDRCLDRIWFLSILFSTSK
jgi:hypothetical protein